MIKHTTSGRSSLLLVAMALLLLPTLNALGYAPLGVLGTVSDNGELVSGAVVTLKAYVQGQEIAQSDNVVSNDEGLFYATLTLPDGVVVDIQISIVTDEHYVELLKGAQGWNVYRVPFALEQESMGIDASRIQTAVPSPDSQIFEEDMNRVKEGESDQELLDKYHLVEEAVVPIADDTKPYVEQARIVTAPPEDKAEIGKQHVSLPLWLLLSIAGIIFTLLFVRFSAHHHSEL